MDKAGQSDAAARWEQVKTLLTEALDKPAGERTAFVYAACGEDAALREELQSLLAAHKEAGTFLDHAAVDLTAPEVDASGRTIGHYHLDKVIGRGGMGEVYLSTREVDGYARPVALKLIRHSALTAASLRRFRMERQILARLNHPAITHLLDGGVTEEGLPYLVTEYIEGRPLDEYLRERQPGLRERLRMFENICEAVAHAHRNFVVHGDLKPGNILVLPGGEIKLLDFGIARLLETADDATEEQPGAMTAPAMTPAWASPEQLRGERAGISSDVYSLGRLLYLLLCGEQPFAMVSMTPVQFHDYLEKAVPAKPSVKTGDRRLAGDLDNIVGKAMDFYSLERYQSAEALAADIRAHLDSRPIAARHATWRYRAWKFVRRNRIGVAAAAAVTLALLAGLAATMWQARIAQRNLEQAQRRFTELRRLANSFLFEMDDEIAKLPGSTAVRATMVRNALQYLDGLATDAGGDETLQEDVASAYEKVGDVQGRPGGANLGGTAAALQSYRKAEGIRRGLRKQEAASAGDRREEALAQTLVRIGAILRATGDAGMALQYDREALEIRRRLLDRKPADTERIRAVAASLTAASASLSQLGAFQGVLELRREGLALYQRLARENPNRQEDIAGLALAHSRMGSILMHEKDMRGALDHYRESLRLQQEVLRRFGASAERAANVGLAHSNYGNALRAAGRHREALVEYDNAGALYRPLVEADPNEVRSRTLLATLRVRRAKTWIEMGEAARALPVLRGVLEERRFLAERNPANAGARGEVAEAYGVMGDAYASMRQAAAAREAYAEAQAILEALRKEGRFNAANREELDRIRERSAAIAPRATGQTATGR